MDTKPASSVGPRLPFSYSAVELMSQDKGARMQQLQSTSPIRPSLRAEVLPQILETIKEFSSVDVLR